MPLLPLVASDSSSGLFAGITVGHEVRKESRASRGYSDCRDAPYSCKVLSSI